MGWILILMIPIGIIVLLVNLFKGDPKDETLGQKSSTAAQAILMILVLFGILILAYFAFAE